MPDLPYTAQGLRVAKSAGTLIHSPIYKSATPAKKAYTTPAPTPNFQTAKLVVNRLKYITRGNVIGSSIIQSQKGIHR